MPEALAAGTVLEGVGIGTATATGRVLRAGAPLPEPSSAARTRAAADEIAAAREAVAAVSAFLNGHAVGASGAAREILEAQAMMADDPTVFDDIESRIQNGSTAERAVFDAFDAFRQLLADGGGYFGDRASDLTDIAQRIIAELRGVPAPGVPTSSDPYILVAEDLAPADTALLDLSVVLAVVTREGGPTSHTAILAREHGIAAIVGVNDADSLRDGTVVIVDARAGRITVDPSPSALSEATERRARGTASAGESAKPGCLADGVAVPLLANLGSADAADAAVALGAEGVGLFRTEFLFLDAQVAPSVETQREHYRRLLAAFAGRKVVVRLLDAGADKPLAFLGIGHEENPALGVRGLRALRASEGVLHDQLTALAQAEAETDAELWVMAPMVSTVEETRYFVDLCREHGIRHAGVMIEVPAAALLAESILRVADFVSIGTNDLTQYTLAADRLLGALAGLQDPWHPAVLRLVKAVGDAGRVLGKPVGICGEAAADPLLAAVLVGLGATSLSMTPAARGDVRAELLTHTAAEVQALAAAALAEDSAAAARAAALRTPITH